MIPPFPNLKIFKHGLQNIKRFTASEYRDIMKVSVFTINGILSSINKKMDIMLTQLYCQWIVMYIMSWNDNHTEISLQEFKVIKKGVPCCNPKKEAKWLQLWLQPPSKIATRISNKKYLN